MDSSDDDDNDNKCCTLSWLYNSTVVCLIHNSVVIGLLL